MECRSAASDSRDPRRKAPLPPALQPRLRRARAEIAEVRPRMGSGTPGPDSAESSCHCLVTCSHWQGRRYRRYRRGTHAEGLARRGVRRFLFLLRYRLPSPSTRHASPRSACLEAPTRTRSTLPASLLPARSQQAASSPIARRLARRSGCAGGACLGRGGVRQRDRRSPDSAGDRFYVRYSRLHPEGAPIGVGHVLWAELRTAAKGTVAIHRFRTRDKMERFWMANGQAATPPPMRLPLESSPISSGFGLRADPFDQPPPAAAVWARAAQAWASPQRRRRRCRLACRPAASAWWQPATAGGALGARCGLPTGPCRRRSVLRPARIPA